MTEDFLTVDILESNARHDREHGDPLHYNATRVRSGWNSAQMARRGMLTDKAIEKYEAAGFYTEEYRDARKKVMESKQRKRDGNFKREDGRMIYSPL